MDSSPSRSGGRIFFSRINFLCWLLFWYLFHPCVTVVAHKKPLSFSQKRRWQVTAMQTCNLHMRLGIKWHSKLVHGYLVTCAKMAAVLCCISHVTTKQCCRSTTSVDIQNAPYKATVTPSKSHVINSAASLPESHTLSVAFWHATGYATEGALFISTQLSSNAVSALWKVRVLITVEAT